MSCTCPNTIHRTHCHSGQFPCVARLYPYAFLVMGRAHIHEIAENAVVNATIYSALIRHVYDPQVPDRLAQARICAEVRAGSKKSTA